MFFSLFGLRMQQHLFGLRLQQMLLIITKKIILELLDMRKRLARWVKTFRRQYFDFFVSLC